MSDAIHIDLAQRFIGLAWHVSGVCPASVCVSEMIRVHVQDGQPVQVLDAITDEVIVTGVLLDNTDASFDNAMHALANHTGLSVFVEDSTSENDYPENVYCYWPA
ncbi:hypothetical protein CS0771_40430 [Catellatospora sp. IY07-71]|uniref:hypothetical protein n=1 Tax=Catellatospora sp. IY07-71 TaxID=2728827 RepID=UPI001BB34EB6|nr:hypothetical protein [Catellatospora sp. IY07-71]BCJ74499.1 hypothetical protein CS0771_40430 [Catellatospora sp. IY07-71]